MSLSILFFFFSFLFPSFPPLFPTFFHEVLLQILPCFSIWTKISPGGNGQNIYPCINTHTEQTNNHICATQIYITLHMRGSCKCNFRHGIFKFSPSFFCYILADHGGGFFLNFPRQNCEKPSLRVKVPHLLVSLNLEGAPLVTFSKLILKALKKAPG